MLIPEGKIKKKKRKRRTCETAPYSAQQDTDRIQHRQTQMFTIAVCLFFGIVWRGLSDLICSPCVFLCLMKSGRFAKYTETIHQTVHSASIAISLNCNAPKHLFCLCLGSEIFRKCQDEQAWLSPLSATVKM